MELKEVVNLRKLAEEFYMVDEFGCDECPFRDVCGMREKSTWCLVGKMVDNDINDMYDDEMEEL